MKKSDSIKEKKGFKIIGYFLKFILSLFLGFLPSFLFVLLFVQYGSPFSNYLKFILNFNSSWIAWISAGIIILLINSIRKSTKSKKDSKNIKTNKFLLVIFILSIIALVVLILLQSYLYVNFLLRNDVLVRLSADKENIFFTDNFNEEVNFKISVITNPFCQVECNYKFSDLSKGEEIESGFFNLVTVYYKTKEYTLNNNHLVQGSQTLTRFEVGCKSKKTLLCYTKEEESKRSILVTINYNLSQENSNFKNSSQIELTSLLENLSFARGKLNDSKNNLVSINNSFSTASFKNKFQFLSDSFSELNNSLVYLKGLWESQNFTALKIGFSDLNNTNKTLISPYEELNLELISNISYYNNLIEDLTGIRQTLEDLPYIAFEESLCTELNLVISHFNNAVFLLNEEKELSGKKVILDNIHNEVNTFYIKTQENVPSATICAIADKITNKSFEKIQLSPPSNLLKISLVNPVPVCCLSGKCSICCDSKCSNQNYPIIFLHGHSINQQLPADYSLDTFLGIKEKLAQTGYIDAGSIITDLRADPIGLLGKANAQMIITGSYFFETRKTASGETTVSSTVESIDTYAIRLKSLIDTMKYRTNKDKVVIVAHSMGGLVTRRYIQIFGAKDVEKIILVTVPNHGLDNKIGDSCKLLGSKLTCSEMDENSDFIDRLNNFPSEYVSTVNIIGVGCNMGDETGDGIIKNSSQYLPYATNYYVQGTCDELNFDFFHESIINPKKTPEAYSILASALK